MLSVAKEHPSFFQLIRKAARKKPPVLFNDCWRELNVAATAPLLLATGGGFLRAPLCTELCLSFWYLLLRKLWTPQGGQTPCGFPSNTCSWSIFLLPENAIFAKKAPLRSSSVKRRQSLPSALAKRFAGLLRIFRETCSTIARQCFGLHHSQHRQAINSASKNAAHLPVYKGLGSANMQVHRHALQEHNTASVAKNTFSFANCIAHLSPRDINQHQWSLNTQLPSKTFEPTRTNPV